MKKKQLLKSIFTLILCVWVIAASFLLMLFIITHLKHDCTGPNCPICEQIRNAENFLNQLGMGLGKNIIAIFICSIICANILHICFLKIPHSLVQLRVQLNN